MCPFVRFLFLTLWLQMTALDNITCQLSQEKWHFQEDHNSHNKDDKFHRSLQQKGVQVLFQDRVLYILRERSLKFSKMGRARTPQIFSARSSFSIPNFSWFWFWFIFGLEKNILKKKFLKYQKNWKFWKIQIRLILATINQINQKREVGNFYVITTQKWQKFGLE